MAKATMFTNNEMFAIAQKSSPAFASATSKMDAKSFFEFAGGLSTQEAKNLVSDFYSLTMMFFLARAQGTRAKNPLAAQGYGVRHTQPYAGLRQHLRVSIKGNINAQYVNVQDGPGADPYRVRKPEVLEIFYTFNDNYQTLMTLNEQQIKTAFANEYGVSMVNNSAMEALNADFIQWEYTHEKEIIGYMVQSVKDRKNQVVDVDRAGEEFTRDELRDIVNSINNTISAMTIQATASFNELEWLDVQDKKDLKLLVRPDFKNALKTHLLESAFNKEDLNIDCDFVETPDFGNVLYLINPEGNIELANCATPMRDDLGSAIKISPEEKKTNKYKDAKVPYKLVKASNTATELTQAEYATVVTVDPYKDVIAIISDKEAIFTVDQNPYQVFGKYNPANHCTTYWADKANVSFNYDKQKNVVLVRVTGTTIPAITPQMINGEA